MAADCGGAPLQASTIVGSMPASYTGDARLDEFAGIASGSRAIFADVGCSTEVRFARGLACVCVGSVTSVVHGLRRRGDVRVARIAGAVARISPTANARRHHQPCGCQP